MCAHLIFAINDDAHETSMIVTYIGVYHPKDCVIMDEFHIQIELCIGHIAPFKPAVW